MSSSTTDGSGAAAQQQCSYEPNTSSELELSSLILELLQHRYDSLVVRLSGSLVVQFLEKMIRTTFHFVGVNSEDSVLSAVNVASFLVALVFCLPFLLAYGLLHRGRRKQNQLKVELQEAKDKLQYLQEQVLSKKGFDANKEVRIFMDGAFDLMHYGHMNAFRLGKSLGTHLVVGVNSDESITKCKAAPLMNDTERLTMVSACKFVDEVVPDCPYIMSKEYLDWVVETYQIDYVVHGDDPCIVDGKDVYATAKETGKFQTIPRTEGVSTTDIVGRMLLLTKEHHMQSTNTNHNAEPPGGFARQSKFLTTSKMLQLFSNNVKSPSSTMKVVYIDGAWDLFHPGHVEVLKAAKARGDYLIVGVHGDAVVNKRRGMNFPLLNLHERVLSVLGCRHVDDVLIDAPYQITPDMITSLHISEVVYGTVKDVYDVLEDREERYRYATKGNLLSEIESPGTFRFKNIVERIQKNQELFQARFERKMAAEARHSDSKTDPSS